MERIMKPISGALVVLGVAAIVYGGLRENLPGLVAGLLMLVSGLHERSVLTIAELRRRIAALETDNGPRAPRRD
jgi:hypothetical protein